MEKERRNMEFQKIIVESNNDDSSFEEMKKKSEEFEKILEVPREERDRIQRMQVIDRAAAAIAAAKAVLKESESDGGELKRDGGGQIGQSDDANSEFLISFFFLFCFSRSL